MILFDVFGALNQCTQKMQGFYVLELPLNEFIQHLIEGRYFVQYFQFDQMKSIVRRDIQDLDSNRSIATSPNGMWQTSASRSK